MWRCLNRVFQYTDKNRLFGSGRKINSDEVAIRQRRCVKTKKRQVFTERRLFNFIFAAGQLMALFNNLIFISNDVEPEHWFEITK